MFGLCWGCVDGILHLYQHSPHENTLMGVGKKFVCICSCSSAAGASLWHRRWSPLLWVHFLGLFNTLKSFSVGVPAPPGMWFFSDRQLWIQRGWLRDWPGQPGLARGSWAANTSQWKPCKTGGTWITSGDCWVISYLEQSWKETVAVVSMPITSRWW